MGSCHWPLVLAISTNGESRVGIQSHDSAWDPLHKSTLGEWTERLVIGHFAAAWPYKGKHAGSSAHLKVGLHSDNMSLWTSEEKEKKEKEEKEEEEERWRRLRSRKKTKEQKED